MALKTFVKMMKSKQGLQEETAQYEEAFKIFDLNGDGRIDFMELRKVLDHIGEERLTDDDVRGMIRDADLNQDGTIDREEFVRMMQNLENL